MTAAVLCATGDKSSTRFAPERLVDLVMFYVSSLFIIVSMICLSFYLSVFSSVSLFYCFFFHYSVPS
jgi:hypothetical protein